MMNRIQRRKASREAREAGEARGARLLIQRLRRAGVTWLATAVAGIAVSSPAAALPIEASVGVGGSTVMVGLEFQDGAEYLFEVAFDDLGTTSGIDVMLTLQSELPSFAVQVLDFGFGAFIDEIAYDGHLDGGFGGDELFWHYWTRSGETEPWVFSQIGAADRIVSDGDWDGWKYGAGWPVPEPGSAVLVGLGLAGLGLRRRRRPRRAGPEAAAKRCDRIDP